MMQIFIVIFLAAFIVEDLIEGLEVSFIDIESIFLWKNATYNDGAYNSMMTKNFSDISLQRVDNILMEVDTFSDEYNEFMNNLRVKQDERWKYVREHHFKSEFLTPVKFKLSTLINNIDYIHKEKINFRIERSYADKMLSARIPFLSDTLIRLSVTLDEIHKLIFSSFTHITPQLMQLILVDTERNLPENCDQYTSAQQFVFFTYVTLIITEMKGFSTLIYISLALQRATQSNDYMIEIEIAEKKFTKRVTDYYKNIYKAMTSIPREIHRCEINNPKRGENFLEFTHYNQVRLITAGHLSGNEHLMNLNCLNKCENINYGRMEIMTDQRIYDCHTIGLAKFIQSCPARSGSNRIYMWWKYDNEIYGRNDGCPSPLQKGDGNTPYIEQCYICQCSVIPQSNKSYENAILNISVTSQISDIKNNMIVTGVQFVIYEKVLHLQIQQSKFMLNKINDNSTVWKSLDDYRTNINESKIHSEILSKFSGQLYLDDIMLPSKYAVTGVRFLARHDSIKGFYLQVHGTPFDIQTGKLVAENAVWFSAGSDFSQKSEYERDRIEINIKNRDDPTRCKEYNYDRTTNNYIEFYHSSVSKDGGQSTVPFIDAQPVDTYPPFPLSGIGLFYRTKPECGGYITPRLFTIDISQYN